MFQCSLVCDRNPTSAAMIAQASIPGPAGNLSFTLSNGDQGNCSLVLEPSSLVFQKASLQTAEVKNNVSKTISSVICCQNCMPPWRSGTSHPGHQPIHADRKGKKKENITLGFVQQEAFQLGAWCLSDQSSQFRKQLCTFRVLICFIMLAQFWTDELCLPQAVV